MVYVTKQHSRNEALQLLQLHVQITELSFIGIVEMNFSCCAD